MFCREQAAQLRGERKQFEERGAQLVFVGNGSPTMAKEFRDQFGIEEPIYIDPSLRTHQALGLRPKGPVLKALAAVPRALAGGHLQGLTKGDQNQLGGAFVIDRTGVVLFEHRSEHAGDHPRVEELVAALPGL